jgi:hypothetical protein
MVRSIPILNQNYLLLSQDNSDALRTNNRNISVFTDKLPGY